MGYPSNGFTFDTLRDANRARLPEFRNALGDLSHPEQPDGAVMNWSLTDWTTALAGEVGEAANIVKKVRRGDLSLNEARPTLAAELADVQCYLDLLALRAGIDLGRATREKFNAVSQRVGSRVYIGENGDWHLREATP